MGTGMVEPCSPCAPGGQLSAGGGVEALGHPLAELVRQLGVQSPLVLRLLDRAERGVHEPAGLTARLVAHALIWVGALGP